MGDHPPTDAAEAVFADLKERTKPRIKEFETLVDKELAAFNQLVAKSELGAVVA